MSEKTKHKLHKRNIHNKEYDFDILVNNYPALKTFVILNKNNTQTINFFDPDAVKALNKALLKSYYNIEFWDIPHGYLCPPVPGRADYIHYLADLLDKPQAKILDIGIGANCIYPIVGVHLYGWTFVGSEIDPIAIENAKSIVSNNPILKNKVVIKKQTNRNEMLFGIIDRSDFFDAVICNPPFHNSKEEADKASKRKLKNLTGKSNPELIKNFKGSNNELWYKGGEKKFIKKIIRESIVFKDNVEWFTVLVSAGKHLTAFQQALKNIDVKEIKIIEMAQGQKSSRILAWKF